MKKTYHGSCHCGTVTFEADIDLAQGTGKCNCSICAKTRNWSVIGKPQDLRVLTGEESLTDYQFGSRSVHHLFCSRCGVRPFGRGHVAELGGDFVSIQLACLDDATAGELASAPVRWMNGRDNDWGNPPAETRHL